MAFWAALYLLRRAQWAVLGQPRPPKVHASPTVALLCERADKEEARQLSIQHGYDYNGTDPDAFLPSPPASLAAQLTLSSEVKKGHIGFQSCIAALQSFRWQGYMPIRGQADVDWRPCALKP